MNSSLFRAVDVGELEATVLAKAEQRGRDGTIPKFVCSKGLGFGRSSLGSFCSTTDPLILHMAADVARREGRELRDGGVANLAARDRVQMKEQILRGLLRDRGNEDGEEEEAAGYVHVSTRSDKHSALNDSRKRREDLVKTGAVSPLDALDDLAVGIVGRQRKTLQDYKMAEGMAVKLPRSRRLKTKRGADNDIGESRHESGGETNNAETGVNTSKSDQNLHGQGRDSSAGTEDVVECPLCTQVVKVDDPTNPDLYLSRHMDRCTRSTRRKSCKQAGEEIGLGSADDTGAKEGSANRKGGSSTSDSQQTQDDCQKQVPSSTRRQSASESIYGSCFGNGKGRRAAKRRKITSRASSEGGGADAVEASVSLKVTGGGQPLVDDFDDEDFEARKAQVVDVSLANGVSEEVPSGANPSELGDGLTMDGGIADRLFQFQLTGVRWMWQLHRQGAGGIVGDEMGLGKTVQVSAFLGALRRSSVMRRALILCPATVLSHWMAELHVWAPQLRVVVLHRCVQAFNAVSGSSEKLRGLVRRILGWPDVIVVTSYAGMKSLKALLLPCNWDYCVLDEGQRIRNPDAEVTLICKQIRTVHRLVLTGTPIQNNLRELWSLFDFVFPGRLGTLPAFEAEFAGPIRVGGYANARREMWTEGEEGRASSASYARGQGSEDQLNVAGGQHSDSGIPDELFMPPCDLRVDGDEARLSTLWESHLRYLQERDSSVAGKIACFSKLQTQGTNAAHMVLFCRLTSYQRRLYGEFLGSTEVKSVLSRTMRAFRAIGILRKLCNHPDLVCRFGDSVVTRLAAHQVWDGASDGSEEDEDDLGEGSKSETEDEMKRSGKLLVLQQILPLWHAQSHRVLLFSQTRQMLSIIERFVKNNGWSYGRLDGSTPVGTRQALIDRFNSDESIFVMLLTTRTGGVGVNLTGADRVILFDPDWNPSTDMQARERSWRVGQLRQVTVYRLVTAGTIEEKIYHRQIFKTAITNRILQDPKQRRMFSADELGDLFTLGDDGALDGFTDTVDLFQGEGKVDAPQGEQRGARRRHSARASGVQGKNAQKSGSRRGKSEALRQRKCSNSSSLLGTKTVSLEPEGGDGENKSSAEVDESGADSKGDDNAVLQALYDGAPLSSVFHHDLAEGSGLMTIEQKRMEEAAKRAAQRAVNQLRMSRHTLRAGAGQGGFQSSWTGRNGGGGPSNLLQDVRQVAGGGIARTQQGARRRFGTVSNPSVVRGLSTYPEKKVVSPGQHEPVLGPGQNSPEGVSSQDILRQIRLRNGAQPAPSPGLFPEFEEARAPDNKDTYFAALLQRLQDYLAQAPSGVDTAALIHAFADVPAGDVPVFRQLLQAVATCANGEWTLRDAQSN